MHEGAHRWQDAVFPAAARGAAQNGNMAGIYLYFVVVFAVLSLLGFRMYLQRQPAQQRSASPGRADHGGRHQGCDPDQACRARDPDVRAAPSMRPGPGHLAVQELAALLKSRRSPQDGLRKSLRPITAAAEGGAADCRVARFIGLHRPPRLPCPRDVRDAQTIALATAPTRRRRRVRTARACSSVSGCSNRADAPRSAEGHVCRVDAVDDVVPSEVRKPSWPRLSRLPSRTLFRPSGGAPNSISLPGQPSGRHGPRQPSQSPLAFDH